MVNHSHLVSCVFKINWLYDISYCTLYLAWITLDIQPSPAMQGRCVPATQDLIQRLFDLFTNLTIDSFRKFIFYLPRVYHLIVLLSQKLTLVSQGEARPTCAREGKGLVNCIYNTCPARMQLVGWRNQISNNTLLNYLLWSKHTPWEV